MRKHIFIAALAALGLMSCEKVIDFKGEAREAKLIVGAVFGTNDEESKHRVSVKESVFLFAGDTPQPVDNAKFRIWRNGSEVPENTEDWGEYGIHSYFQFPIVAGDKLTLECETPKHGRVSATDVVPAQADFQKLETEWFQTGNDNKWHLRTLITLADPAGEKNYYRIKIRSVTDFRHGYYASSTDTEMSWIEDSRRDDHGTGFTDREIVFSNFSGDPIGGTEGWGQFADELIDGREYMLNLYIQLDRDLSVWEDSRNKYEITKQSVTVEIQTLSENLFKYLRSAEMLDAEHNFSEPVRLFSNVSGGYGIFGVYNATSKTVELSLE